MAVFIGWVLILGLSSQNVFAQQYDFQTFKDDHDCIAVETLVQWSPFVNDQTCLQFIDEDIPPCFYKMFHASKATVITRSFNEFIEQRSSTVEPFGICENFVISFNSTKIVEIFRKNESPGQRRYSMFSSIFVVRGSVRLEEEIPLEFSQAALEYIHNETLNVFVIETRSTESGSVRLMTLKNVLTRKSLVLSNGQDLSRFYGLKTSHPFLNVSDTSKQLTVTFFNCPPYIFESNER